MSCCLTPTVRRGGGLAAALARALRQAVRLEAAGREEERRADRERINQRAEQLLDRHGDRVLRLAYSYLHNLDDAEEVLQDTLIQYLRTAPAFSGEDHERAWMLRVAANLSKNRISYNRIRKTDELKETLAAQQREDLSFVWDAVKELPVNYREVIHLFYYEGLSGPVPAHAGTGKTESHFKGGV